MDLRLALHDLAAQHRLDVDATKRLHQLSNLDSQPKTLSYWLPRGVAVLAAAIGGFGIILWIAANWEILGRFARFGLLEAFFVIMCVGALARPNARAALGLLAFLTIGGLFAYFGQTYQTGTDPWQLFAIWALLALPLCLAARSDVVWVPWAIVVIVAISLWVFAHTGHRWRIQASDFSAHAVGLVAALLLTFALGPMLRRFTGAGPWALRTALTLATIMITMTAIGGLFHVDVAPHYWLALVILVVAAGLMTMPNLFEIFGLSAVGLALNVLLICGLGRLLFDDMKFSSLGAFVLLGIAAAGLLAATVSVILRLSSRQANEGAAA